MQAQTRAHGTFSFVGLLRSCYGQRRRRQRRPGSPHPTHVMPLRGRARSQRRHPPSRCRRPVAVHERWTVRPSLRGWRQRRPGPPGWWAPKSKHLQPASMSKPFSPLNHPLKRLSLCREWRLLLYQLHQWHRSPLPRQPNHSKRQSVVEKLWCLDPRPRQTTATNPPTPAVAAPQARHHRRHLRWCLQPPLARQLVAHLHVRSPR